VLVNKHNGIVPYLAAGLACASACLICTPLYASEVSRYSFGLYYGMSAPAATATQAQPWPYGYVKEHVARMKHLQDSDMQVAMLSRWVVLQQDMQIIRGELGDDRHNGGSLQHRQREVYVDEGRHLSDLEAGKTNIVPDKNDDNGSPTQSNVTPRLPGATPQLPNAIPRLPGATPQLPNAVPQLPNATPQLPNAVPRLPNATPQLPNATPPASGGNPQMPVFQQHRGVP
jgi:TolA binding protein trimerisation